MTKVSSYTYLCVLRYPYEIYRSENEDYQSYSYIKVIRFYDFFLKEGLHILIFTINLHKGKFDNIKTLRN